MNVADSDDWPSFPDDAWNAICGAIGTDVGDADLRRRISEIAAALRVNRSSLQRPMRKDDERKRYKNIAKAAAILREEIGHFTQWEQAFLLFAKIDFIPAADLQSEIDVELNRLEWVYEVAQGLSKPESKPVANVDELRNSAWEQLAVLFEQRTGRRPTVNVGAQTTKTAGKPGGKFVELILAFTSAVPGETATPESVRWFVRNRPARKFESAKGLRAFREMIQHCDAAQARLTRSIPDPVQKPVLPAETARPGE
jgi:hypothetical protein